MRRWLLLGAIALVVRLAASWTLGPSPFGPDAPGAAAAAVLGGHPYPLHPWLIGLVGARPLSLAAGVLTVWACASLGESWGKAFWGPGLVAACAPLLVYPSALDGGDALAIALASSGLALAARRHGLVGGALAAASVWAKPLALPLVPLLLFTPAPVSAAAAAVATLGLSRTLLAPLLWPKPRAGLLGSWWASSDGAPPPLGAWPELAWAGVERLWELPVWTGHPVLGLLALVGALAWAPGRRRRLGLWLAAAACLAGTAAVLGDVLRPRYLGAASVPLAVLAGIALRPVAPAALLLLWPTAALLTQVGAFRAAEEGLSPPPRVAWPPVAADAEFRDASVCGGLALRALAEELAAELPEGHEVIALRLRDGRQNDLLWPLQAHRPDLRATVFHAGCCQDLGPGACAARLRFHLDQGATLVSPTPGAPCESEQVDPGEAPLAEAVAGWLGAGDRVAHLTVPGGGVARDACRAVGARPAR